MFQSPKTLGGWQREIKMKEFVVEAMEMKDQWPNILDVKLITPVIKQLRDSLLLRIEYMHYNGIDLFN